MDEKGYQCWFHLHFPIVHGFKYLSHVLSVNRSFKSSDCNFIGILLISSFLLKTCWHIKVLGFYCWCTLGTFPPPGSWLLSFNFFPCDVYLPGVCDCLVFQCFFYWLVGFLLFVCLFSGRCWLFWMGFLFVWWLVWFEHTGFYF